MKLKLADLIKSQDALMELGKQKLPVVLSYKISLILKKVRPELESYEKVRVEKIKEFGEVEKDKDGKETGDYSIDRNNKEIWEKFVKELEEVGEQELELDIVELETKDFPADIMLSPVQMESISWLLKD